MVNTIDIGSIGDTKLLILSDLHIGDPRHHHGVLAALYGVVRAEQPEFLVLAGDILEGRLATKSQIGQLRGICRLVNHVSVLRGNHDLTATAEFAEAFGGNYGAKLIGISATSAFVVEHGDRFDKTWSSYPRLGRIGIWFNRIVYRVVRLDLQLAARRLSCVHQHLLQQHTRAREAWPDRPIVVTGHTHLPTNDPFGVGYFNSGDWLYHRTYVTIHSGTAELKTVT